MHDWRSEIDWVRSIPFWGVHVVAIAGVARLGWSWNGFAIAAGSYAVRMFGVTAGLHRYFSHRAFKASRPVQLALAILGMLAAQKGLLWWAAHHRHHHAFSDKPEDVHSVRQDGFLWAHLGWFLAYQNKQTRWERVPDLARYPELRWLDRHDVLPSVIFALLLYSIGGSTALIWGYFVSTVALWHGTFTINSLAHLWGRRRYATGDDSRNNALLALVTLGEGWHNNHHHYPRSASQGFYWWEIDLSYALLRLASFVGLVSGVGRPPAHVRDG